MPNFVFHLVFLCSLIVSCFGGPIGAYNSGSDVHLASSGYVYIDPQNSTDILLNGQLVVGSSLPSLFAQEEYVSEVFPYQMNNMRYQQLTANSPASVTVFSIGTNNFIILPGFNYSYIWVWNSVTSQFILNQTLTHVSQEVRKWTFFTITGTSRYFIIPSVASLGYANATILEYLSGSFQSFQNLQTINCYDFEYWEYGALPVHSFLISAVYGDGGANSTLYSWNGTAWSLNQIFPTTGAECWNIFKVEGLTLLAVCNSHVNEANSSAYNQTISIWKYDGSTFSSYQNLTAYDAGAVEFFTINSNSFLAVAELNTLSPTPQRIWEWDTTALMFVQYQSILAIGANSWDFFSISNEYFLILAVVSSPTNGPNEPSRLFRFAGNSFQEVNPSIATYGATSWQYFQIGSSSYLVVSNSGTGNGAAQTSVVYKISPL